MGATTGIPYVDATWNPVSGCTKISPGCQHCYAERETLRWKRGPFDTVHIHESRLGEPAKWPKGKKVLTPSMGDLYHPLVPPEYRDQVFAVMAAEERHTFFLLTKRPGLMVHDAALRQWPKNVWPGVSVENQEWAWRIEVLAELRGIAPVLWVSLEPLLGPVNLGPWLQSNEGVPGHCFSIDGDRWHPLGGCAGASTNCSGRCCNQPVLSLVILGGESGPRARPMHPAWPRSVRDQCRAAGVPFFFKQWGEWVPSYFAAFPGEPMRAERFEDGVRVFRTGRKRAGALLDGREWTEMPQRCLMPQAPNEIVHASAT